MKKLSLENVFEVVKMNPGATYYIANLLKLKYPDWERNVTEVRKILKMLKDRGYVDNYETSYKRQLSWKAN